MTLDPNHPKQHFRFFCPGNISEQAKRLLVSYVSNASISRNWLLGEPQIIESVDHPEGLGEEGGFLEVRISLFSALPPWDTRLPRPVDEAHFQEASELVKLASRFSADSSVDLDFFLDDVFVGHVNAGTPDNLLTVGLLGEWQKGLQLRR